MRVVLLANNRVGLRIARSLQAGDDDIIGVIVHPEGGASHREGIVAASGLSAEHVFDGARLREPPVLAAIRALGADMAVSAMFGYILKPEFLDLFPLGCINVHPGMLPYNRGAYPNVWSIVEGTPSGVTVHYMDEDVDTGDIISQRPVPVTPTDTGETLYRRLEEAAVGLFEETWPKIAAGTAISRPQAPQQKGVAGPGPGHRARDVDDLDEINLDAEYTASKLIDILRARTFPPYSGAYFMHNGEKIYMRLYLYSEGESVETENETDN